MGHRVTVRNARRTVDVDDGETILDAAILAGIDYPCNCQSGTCGSCKSDLISGEVDMMPYAGFALPDAERAAGAILACRAVPRSDCEVAWRVPDEVARHPVRKIACLVADRAGSDLWPDGERRYDVLRWLAWEGAHWTRPIGAILGQVVFNADNPDGAIVDKGRDDFRVLAGVLDGHLATRDFLAGQAPTVADYAVGVWLGYADLCGLPLAEFARLSAWGARLADLPGWPETAPPQ